MSEQNDGQQQNNEQQEQSPPWGDDFDANKAWNLVQNLRGDKERLKGELTQANADREELETLRRDKLTADERAVADARDQAAAEARAAVEAEYKPQLQAEKLGRIAGTILHSKEQLDSFLDIADPAKFLNDAGDVDEEKVIGHLTGMFGSTQQQTPSREWGQGGQRPPGESAREQGLAEARRRGYITDKE